MSGLSFNPSYTTNEVVFDSCPSVSASNVSTSAYTKNVPRQYGDSVLGTYGRAYDLFGHKDPSCFKCDMCENNTVTPLFFRSHRSYAHPTYALAYVGRDNLYRNPY